MKNYKKLILIALVISCSMSLLAQDGIGKTISIKFTELNQQSSYEEVQEFLSNYSQYQMKIMYWEGFWGETIHLAVFMFNTQLIDEESLIDLLMNDNLVEEVNRDGYWTPFCPRQFIIRLSNETDELEFINYYSEYGFAGSINSNTNWFGEDNLKLYSFNDTVIYPGTFWDILKADERVEFVHPLKTWVSGTYLLDLREPDDIHSLIEEYPHLDFSDHWNGLVWQASVCFIEYDEFEILRQLNNDDRVLRSDFVNGLPGIMINWFLPQQPPVSDKSEYAIKPIFTVSTYPNPVWKSNVTIKINNSDIKRPNLLPVVKIFNIKGQLLKSSTMVNEAYVWDRKDTNGRDVSSGIYFIKVTDNDISQTKKIIITK